MSHNALARLTALILTVFQLSSCGYTMRGMEGYGSKVLGDGTRTVRIGEVDHTTMFPWIPYVVHAGVIDGIRQRGLAKVTEGQGDFVIDAKVTDYSNTNDNDTSDASYLFTIDVTMRLTIKDGRTNEVLWHSGAIRYSSSYQTESEVTAVRDVTTECIRRALDKLEQEF